MECRCNGGAGRTTEGDAVPTRPTTDGLRAAAFASLLFLAAGVALAGPAAAAQDPAAPQATVTKGPSCDPGGMEIEIVAGTAPYSVVLATTRDPDGEDEARLAPRATVFVHTGPIAWGETVAPRLEYTALDASGTSFTDELPDWSMTRPSRKDCAAIGAPAAIETTTPAPAGTTAGGQAPPAQTADPSTPASAPQTPAETPEPEQSTPTAAVASGAAGGDGPSSRAVGAGRPITVHATGFSPGEEVTVRLRGADDVLGHATAGPDGGVEVGLLVPATASGTTTFDLVGGTSGVTTGLRLQVAAQQTALPAGAAPTSWPALLALISLVCAGGGLVVALGRRHLGARRARPLGG